MSEKREFKEQEFKIELKLVAILSVDDINDLKTKIPELIKDKISYNNFPYIFKQDGLIKTGSMSGRTYIKCKISKYDGISKDEKDFMNGEVADVRNTFPSTFSSEQAAKINDIYYKIEKEVETTFNESEYLKENMENSWLEYHEKEKEEKEQIWQK